MTWCPTPETTLVVNSKLNSRRLKLPQKWRSRPGDGAGSFDPVVGDGEGGDSTGFLVTS